MNTKGYPLRMYILTTTFSDYEENLHCNNYFQKCSPNKRSEESSNSGAFKIKPLNFKSNCENINRHFSSSNNSISTIVPAKNSLILQSKSKIQTEGSKRAWSSKSVFLQSTPANPQFESYDNRSPEKQDRSKIQKTNSSDSIATNSSIFKIPKHI